MTDREHEQGTVLEQVDRTMQWQLYRAFFASSILVFMLVAAVTLYLGLLDGALAAFLGIAFSAFGLGALSEDDE